jgi:hypothetical protein
MVGGETMILICEQCDKPIELRPCNRESITIKCSCGAVYEIDFAKMDYKRVVTDRNGNHLDMTTKGHPHDRIKKEAQ